MRPFWQYEAAGFADEALLARERVDCLFSFVQACVTLTVISFVLRRWDPTVKHLQSTLVIARYNEDVSWLAAVPPHIKIVIYNKGDVLPALGLGDRDIEVIPKPNYGRESETFAYHLKSRYEQHTDWTYFAQGEPFSHAPHLIELLQRRPRSPTCEPLTSQWLLKVNVPPQEVLSVYLQKHPGQLTRLERLCTRTLASLYFHDVGVKWIAEGYSKIYGLPVGANLMHHFYEQLGLKDWISPDTEVINFAWSAMVGMSRAAILQHPLSVYDKMCALSVRDAVFGYVIERCWFTLFDRMAGVAYEPQFHVSAAADT